MKQECIPVGFIPSATVAVLGVVCLSRGVSAQGMSAQGGLHREGCLSRGCLPRGCLSRGLCVCLSRGVCVCSEGVYLSVQRRVCVCPGGVYASMQWGRHPPTPVLTEFLTHACENLWQGTMCPTELKVEGTKNRDALDHPRTPDHLAFHRDIYYCGQ